MRISRGHGVDSEDNIGTLEHKVEKSSTRSFANFIQTKGIVGQRLTTEFESASRLPALRLLMLLLRSGKGGWRVTGIDILLQRYMQLCIERKLFDNLSSYRLRQHTDNIRPYFARCNSWLLKQYECTPYILHCFLRNYFTQSIFKQF